MKEATGELNMTVITVVAIAAVAAFFYAFLWPTIQNGLAKNTCNNSSPSGKGYYDPATKCCYEADADGNQTGMDPLNNCDQGATDNP